jgi:MYXO-CTERM domain-containing protein
MTCGKMSLLRRSAFIFGVLAATAACSGTSAEATRRTHEDPIVHGVPSDASQDAVVLLIHDDGTTQDFCTGTLIAPNLVLTARHCVSATGDAGFSCGSDGVGSPEGDVGADFAPSSLTIYTGVALPGASDPPAGTGKQIFHDDAKNLCNHDLALVLLDAPVPGAKLAALRLADTTKPGEKVTTVGWGVTDTTFDPETRMQRTGVNIKFVGMDVVHDVASNEFEVGESICDGDSGGPALSAAGAIVGIVSRGGNDDPSPDADVPGSGCIDPGASNDFTKVSSFTSLILTAFDAAGAKPIREGETPGSDAGPATDAGADGATGEDAGPSGSSDAAPTAPAATSSSSGCATHGSSQEGSMLGAALLVAGAFIARRRRRV